MRRSVVPLVGSGALLLGTIGLTGPVGAQAGPDVEFAYTGAPEEWVVPADVCSVTVQAFGAEGGISYQEPFEEEDVPAPGGSATAILDVTPGATLTVRVGGRGTAGDYDTGTGGAGGWNGGGDGGSTGDAGGAGGGGATDISLDGTRLLVAGGGGGAGAFLNPGDARGGSGGGEVGLDGTVGGEVVNLPGLGGTQVAGGAGGAGSDAAPSGEAGSSGQGGAGGSAVGGIEDDYNGGGGGGGGGWFGGGGGGAVLPGDGSAAGGGGGSGYGPAGVTFETGVRAGDGLLTITYGDEPCPDTTTTTAPSTTTTAGPTATTAAPRATAAQAVTAQPRYTG